MSSYRIVLKNPGLATELNEHTAAYQDKIIAVLNRAREIEKPEDFEKLSRGIADTLATLGSNILFPIYRQHFQLTPPQLRDAVERDLRKARGSS